LGNQINLYSISLKLRTLLLSPTSLLLPVLPDTSNVHRLKFEPSRTLFTGDRLGTDISFAKRGGLDSLLVLSGLQTKEEAYDLKGKDQPEWIAECVGKLLMAKGE